MRLSYIINTCANDPLARSGSRARAYAERCALLRDRVLPAAQGFDELIVVGQFEPPDTRAERAYRYVEVSPRRRDRSDALLQREIGARFATGDILVFGHDDHAVGDGFAETLRELADEPWGILVPKRVHGVTGEPLNNGRADDYMGGHVLAMRRVVWARTPWTVVDTEYWDVVMTMEWRAAGAEIVWSDEIECVDVEAKEGEL